MNEYVEGDVKAATLTSAQRRDSSAHDYTHQHPPNPPAAKKPRKRHSGEKSHNVVGGHHQTHRSNKPLCWSYSNRICTGQSGIACPRSADRVHLCSCCLAADHNALNCDTVPTTPN